MSSGLVLLGVAHATEPVPVHHSDVVTQKTEPVYTTALQKDGHEGLCRVSVVIDETAALVSVLPKEEGSCSDPLVGMLSETVEQWTFRPWTVDGVPVPSTFQLMYRFEILRDEWWRDGSRPEGLPWPPPVDGDPPGPYTPLPFEAMEGRIKHAEEPIFPDELKTMVAGDISCMLVLYFDEQGQAYGAIVEACPQVVSRSILAAAPRWRILPTPEDTPLPGAMRMKLTFKLR